MDDQNKNNENKQYDFEEAPLNKDNNNIKQSISDRIIGYVQRLFNKYISKDKDKFAEEEYNRLIAQQKNIEDKELLEAHRIYERGLASIKDLIAPSSMNIGYSTLFFSDIYAQTLFVYGYPRYLFTGWFADIINSDYNMDISMFFYPIDSSDILSKMRTKVAQLESSIYMQREKGIVVDAKLEATLRDIEDLRNRLTVGESKFFQFGLYITLYDEDKLNLTKTVKQLESILGGRLIMTKRADIRVEQGFNSTLPLCLDELEVTRNMDTTPLSTIFPFMSSELSHDDGIFYGINEDNDSLIIFDRFKMENANMVIFATSGAGKSYTAKLEILRQLMIGTEIIVIDPENEFKSLCHIVGGSWIPLSLNSEYKINPFDLPLPLKDENLKTGDLLRQAIISLSGLINILFDGKISVEENALLDQALIDTYAIKGITMDTENPGEIPPPTLEDLYSVLTTMKNTEKMAQQLAKYVTGTFEGVFNRPTNIKINNQLIVFSIRDLEEELRPAMMYLVLNFIWNKVRSSLKKRILVVDEAWIMMKYEDSAKFLFGLAKRARKYYLGITTISQDVNDLINSKYGMAIVTNAATQILLKQNAAAIDKLGEVFHLTDNEKIKLLGSPVGKGIFFAGQKHVSVSILASAVEHSIITTNPEEVLKNQAKMEEENE